MFVLFTNDTWSIDVLWGKSNYPLIVMKNMAEASDKIDGIIRCLSDENRCESI